MNEQKLNEWHRRMDDVTKGFRNLEINNFKLKLNPETWSIAQVLDHLILINRSYYATFDAVREESYSVKIHGKLGFLNRAMGRIILNSVEPGRKRKSKTLPIWEPKEGDTGHEILEVFEREQDQLKSWMVLLSKVSYAQQPISSPANKSVIYPLASAFEIIVTHEERHLEQAREISDALTEKTDEIHLS